MNVDNTWILAMGLASYGFLGSLHCGLMCGPLCASLGSQGSKVGLRARILPNLIYLLGKALSYGTLGLVGGLLGSLVQSAFRKSLGTLFPSNTFLSSLSGPFVNLGNLSLLFLWIAGCITIVFHQVWFKKQFSFGKGSYFFGILNLIPRSSESLRMGLLGGLSALLPCPFLWGGLLQATGLSHPIHSGMAMVLFAFVTTPAVWFSKGLLNRFRFAFSPKWASLLGISFATFGALGFICMPHHGHHPEVKDTEKTQAPQVESPSDHSHH